MTRRTAWQAAVLAGGLSLGAAPVAGQGVGTDTAAQAYAPTDFTASSESEQDRANTLQVAGSIVLPPRSDADLEQAIQAADQALNRADAELASATERRDRAEEMLQGRELRLSQIESVEGQKAAELAKPRRDSLEAEERALRRRLPLSKDLVALANLEIDVARTARDVAIAEQQALESERMLVRQRAGADGDTQSVLDLVRETLVAQKKNARLVERMASKRALVSSKRLDLFRAYLDVRVREGS